MTCGQIEVRILAWEFDDGELDQDDVRALLSQHFAEMQAGSPPEACHVLPIDGLKAPEIRFYTVRENGALLGCGALKILAGDHCELKSMRTANTALGQGVGQAMLDHLLETARKQGIIRVSLETGSTDQFAAANRLYEKNGFERTGPFGDYPDTAWTYFYTRTI
jgi:putative acetyltransferase